MKFDPDSDYATHRDAAGGRHLIQDGHRFSIGEDHRHLGKEGGPDKPDKPKESKAEKKLRKDVRKRAKKRLDGFRDEKPTGSIADALGENRAAAAAEEHAE